jgi:cytochrome P450
MLMNTPSDEEESGAMSDRQLRDELVTLFMAGHETTANALTWAWYLLSQYPDVETKLRSELKDVQADGGPSLSTMQNFPYLQMFVKEVLRLYPPVWLMSRTVLEEVNISGYRIPAGALILLSPYVMHRDPRFFPEPQRFDPERWAADKTEKPHPFSYFPFGGGPRRCIGEGFAWLEIALVIATLLPRWRMSLAPHQKVEVQPLITLRAKRGIHMRLAAIG